MTWTGWAWDADAGRWCAVANDGSLDECNRRLLDHAAGVPTDWRGLTGGAAPSWEPKPETRTRRKP